MSEFPTQDEEVVEIGDLPDDLIDALHQRAQEKGKTLEQEVRSILEDHLDQNAANID